MPASRQRPEPSSLVDATKVFVDIPVTGVLQHRLVDLSSPELPSLPALDVEAIERDRPSRLRCQSARARESSASKPPLETLKQPISSEIQHAHARRPVGARGQPLRLPASSLMADRPREGEGSCGAAAETEGYNARVTERADATPHQLLPKP